MAAAAVFHEKGYEASTLTDVAGILNLRRATVYYYVQSKEHLLYLILDRAFTNVLEELRELQCLEDPVARLTALLHFQVCTISSHPSLFGVLFDRRPALGFPYEEKVRASEGEVFDVYHSIVRAAVDAGAVADVDSWYATQAIVGMTTWVYKWWRPDQDDREIFAERCVRLILRPRPYLVQGF